MARRESVIRQDLAVASHSQAADRRAGRSSTARPKQHKSDEAAPPRTTTSSAHTHALALDGGCCRPTPFAFSKRYICFTMLRSLVAAFVAVAASTSAFTVSPLASHRNCAASHAGSSAPLSMAESDADKIRCVAVLFAVNRELHVWPTRFIRVCHWAYFVCTLLRSPPLIYLAMNTILICFILFSHQNINSVVTLELLLTSITAKPPSLMP